MLLKKIDKTKKKDGIVNEIDGQLMLKQIDSYKYSL